MAKHPVFKLGAPHCIESLQCLSFCAGYIARISWSRIAIQHRRVFGGICWGNTQEQFAWIIMFLRMRFQCCVSMKRFPSADHWKINMDLLLYNVQGRFATAVWNKSRNVYGPFELWRTWQVFLQLPEYRFLLRMHSHCQEHKLVPSFISMHCFYYLPVSGKKKNLRSSNLKSQRAVKPISPGLSFRFSRPVQARCWSRNVIRSS